MSPWVTPTKKILRVTPTKKISRAMLTNKISWPLPMAMLWTLPRAGMRLRIWVLALVGLTSWASMLLFAGTASAQSVLSRPSQAAWDTVGLPAHLQQSATQESSCRPLPPPTDPQNRRDCLRKQIEQEVAQQNPQQLEVLAREFVQEHPDDPWFPYAFFYLTRARFAQFLPLEDSFFFDSHALDQLSAEARSAYLRMRAEDAWRSGDSAAAADWWMREHEDPLGVQQTNAQEIENALSQLSHIEQFEAFLAAHERPPWLEAGEAFLRAQIWLNAGQRELARPLLEEIERKGLADTEAKRRRLEQLYRALRWQAGTHVQNIGVLLPLSSGNALLRAWAEDTLDGLHMAVREMSAQRLPKDAERDLAELDIELVIRDTANQPEQAAQGVLELVREGQIAAIVGPLARIESERAALEAERWRIPLISFSPSMEILPGTRYTFRNARSYSSEMRDLIAYAVDYQNIRRFAMLYPYTTQGFAMRALFIEQVALRGGEITALLGYTPQRVLRAQGLRREVVFERVFEAFTAQDRQIAKEDRALLKELKQTTAEPKVDFGALFLPIDPLGVEDLFLVAPYPVTVNAEHVALLGNRYWNNDLVLTAEERLEGAVFVDGYDSLRAETTGFLMRHRALFGHRSRYRRPSRYTALAYDMGAYLYQLLRDPALRSTAELLRALRTKPVLGRMSGAFRFAVQGDAIKEERFLRIQRGNALLISP